MMTKFLLVWLEVCNGYDESFFRPSGPTIESEYKKGDMVRGYVK